MKALILAALLSSSPAQAATILIDGDTFVLDGEKVRIINIDTPETWRPRCEAELILGLKAKARLRKLLDSGPLTIVREGHDHWGRSLAYVIAGETDVGDRLIAEGLALPYRRGPAAKAARLAAWCGR